MMPNYRVYPIIAALLLALCAPAGATIALYGTPVPVFVGSAAASQTLALPNGGTLLSADTCYILFIAYDQGSGNAVTTPSTWSVATGSPWADANNIIALYRFYKNYASGTTPPSTVTIAVTNTGGHLYEISTAYQGVQSGCTTDVNDNTTLSQTAANTVPMPNITPTTVGDEILSFAGGGGDIGAGGTQNFTTGTKETEITRSASAAAGYFAYADWPWSTGSSANTLGTFTNAIGSANYPRMGLTVALKPSGATPTPNVAGLIIP